MSDPIYTDPLEFGEGVMSLRAMADADPEAATQAIADRLMTVYLQLMAAMGHDRMDLVREAHNRAAMTIDLVPPPILHHMLDGVIDEAIANTGDEES